MLHWPSADDVVAAIQLHVEAHLSFWDATLVHAASELDCRVLWTEDLDDDQVIRGVHVRNPFTVRRSGTPHEH